jgi:hypothetical protein
MLRIIEGLPESAIGFEASGRVTHEDYRDVLIPKVEALLAHGHVDMLYAFRDDFTGFDLEALWDDAAFGLKHWHHFHRVALVADQTWLRAAFSMFSPLVPAETRLFHRSEMDDAENWIAQTRSTQ